MMTERRAVKLPQVRSELEFASHICERAKEDPQNQAVPCPCLNELIFWMWLMAEDTTEAVDTRRNQRHKIPLREMNKDAGLWLGFSSLILRRVMPSHAAWLKKMYLWRVYKKRDPTTGLARVFYITFRRSKWWFSPSALLLMFNVFGTAWIWGLYWVDCKDLFSFLTHS